VSRTDPHVSTIVVSTALASGIPIQRSDLPLSKRGSHTEEDLTAGMSAYNPERAAELLAALEEYRLARERLLSVLGPRMSNRDPLAEFAEHFVADDRQPSGRVLIQFSVVHTGLLSTQRPRCQRCPSVLDEDKI
jgi:hypothetical protein